MAKLFQAELQIITDDKGTVEKVEKLLTKALDTLKVSGDIIVRPCGTLDDEEDDDDDYIDEYEPETGDPY